LGIDVAFSGDGRSGGLRSFNLGKSLVENFVDRSQGKGEAISGFAWIFQKFVKYRLHDDSVGACVGGKTLAIQMASFAAAFGMGRFLGRFPMRPATLWTRLA
jgi:hypothetical protein